MSMSTFGMVNHTSPMNFLPLTNPHDCLTRYTVARKVPSAAASEYLRSSKNSE